MQGPIYYVTFENQSFTNANGDYDFVELTPADEGGIEIVGFELQCFETDAEEYLRVQWFSDNATSGNGSAATPRPQNPLVTSTAVFAAETVASTPASTGTAIGLPTHYVAAKGGTQGPIWYPDGCGPRVTQSDTMLCLRLAAAVADDAVFSGTFYVMLV
jgi:hypothetical protein